MHAVADLLCFKMKQVKYPYKGTAARPLRKWAEQWLPDDQYGVQAVHPDRYALPFQHISGCICGHAPCA